MIHYSESAFPFGSLIPRVKLSSLLWLNMTRKEPSCSLPVRTEGSNLHLEWQGSNYVGKASVPEMNERRQSVLTRSFRFPQFQSGIPRLNWIDCLREIVRSTFTARSR